MTWGQLRNLVKTGANKLPLLCSSLQAGGWDCLWCGVVVGKDGVMMEWAGTQLASWLVVFWVCCGLNKKSVVDGCSSGRGRQRLVMVGRLVGGSGEACKIACTRVETR